MRQRVRKYAIAPAVYEFRDGFRKGKYGWTEYAVSNKNGSKKWLPGYEGMRFVDAAPLRIRNKNANG